MAKPQPSSSDEGYQARFNAAAPHPNSLLALTIGNKERRRQYQQWRKGWEEDVKVKLAQVREICREGGSGGGAIQYYNRQINEAIGEAA
jgi:hypothetical protein